MRELNSKSVYVLNIENDGDVVSNSINAVKLKTLHFPIGLGLIVGAINQMTDFHVEVFDNYVPGITLNEIFDKIGKNLPEYIFLTGFLGNFQYKFLKDTIKKIKIKNSACHIIMGGPMATCIPEILLTHTDIDIVVVGEGEETVLDLLLHLDERKNLHSCNGIAYKINDTVIITQPRQRIKNLSKYPFPAYEFFDTPKYADYLKETGRCWEISTSRGCYGRCNYCKLTFGKKITFRPIWHILDEIRFIIENFDINRFNFVDDNFLNSTKQVMHFVESLKKFEYKIGFRFQGRVDRIAIDIARALKKVGCFDISMGIESGSSRILRQMNKNLDLSKGLENIKRILDNGLDIHATFIVGMPGENPESIEETLNFIKASKLRHVAAGILTPFPGTKIYEQARALGLITDDEKYCLELGRVYEKPYINMTNYPDEQLLRWANQIDSLSF